MKNLLSLHELDKKDITNILQIAAQMRRIYTTGSKKGPQLIGSVVGGVWTNCCLSSTAFGLATSYMSGAFCPVYGAENKADSCLALDSMGVNTVVAQMSDLNEIKRVAALMRCATVNGGTSDSDPITALADLMTLNIKLDGLQNLNVSVVGNRDVNAMDELNYCLHLFGSDLVWYLPSYDIQTPRTGIVLDDPTAAFAGADAVIDLGLGNGCDGASYYGSAEGIPDELLDKAHVNCPLLGCRTVAHGGVRALYNDSVENLRQSCYVAVAMAVLYLVRKN